MSPQPWSCATPAWSRGMADLRAISEKRERAFRTAMRRGQRLARLAHPETTGNECLCRNWGNAEANRLWSQTWDRWHRYSTAADARWHARLDRMKAEDEKESKA